MKKSTKIMLSTGIIGGLVGGGIALYTYKKSHEIKHYTDAEELLEDNRRAIMEKREKEKLELEKKTQKVSFLEHLIHMKQRIEYLILMELGKCKRENPEIE